MFDFIEEAFFYSILLLEDSMKKKTKNILPYLEAGVLHMNLVKYEYACR